MDISSLLTGENAAFLDAQYQAWLRDPDAVLPEWARFFAAQGGAQPDGGRSPGARPSFRAPTIFNPSARGASATEAEVLAAAQRQARAAQLINAYRVRGHTEADIDPLGMVENVAHPELTLEYYGLSEADLDRPVSGHFVYGVPEVTTLRTIITRLRTAYCGTFGVEFMNIPDPEKKRWLQQRFERLQDSPGLSREDELRVLHKLSDAEGFERFIHNRFPGTKRFSLEGAETLIPLLDLAIEQLADSGVDEIILGMAHRGRLNVLANILGKPVRYIVNEFQDTGADTFQGSGDVKYHLGYASTRVARCGRPVRLSLAFNPSHLEAVDPVVEGRVRARQDRLGVRAHATVVPMLLHGDAAFAGQGLVAEVLNLSELTGYRTGGTIHVIVNNQIGFTTAPKDARSTPYCTDVARMLAVPIFHVNGEDPVAVAQVVAIAVEWRQTFHQDVIIDMYCFRKHGHNEGDEPSFTQPRLYEAIRSHPTARVVYARRMIARGELTPDDVDRISGESRERLEQELAEGPDPSGWDSYEGDLSSPMGQLWTRHRSGSVHDEVDTRVPIDHLRGLLLRANEVPADFKAHRKIVRLLDQRREMANGERPIDWGVGEQAAFATLVDEGVRVRLSGQDSGRGTFSHRHAALLDTRTGAEYRPLQHLTETQATFQVFDSLLSEAGVLGFEFGYTLDYPDALVLWEAQFGDFANGAQVIIDNFIMATEQKWNRCSGLVCLLPHGYEGQGPEHSSARVERYLQLCAEDNVIVANCTTPASFYHLLRRQALMRARKPLVVMSPKSLLRNPACASSLEELAEGHFQRVIPDIEVDPAEVQRVIFCSGKVYYDLRDERERRGERRVALVRLEQLYPMPDREVRAFLDACPLGPEVVWCQEEPRNMGAWPMMDEWMGEILGGTPPRYIGRKRAASPATGSPATHRRELAALLDAAFSL